MVKVKTENKKEINILRIGKVMIFGSTVLIPKTKLVFIDRKTGEGKIRKWESLSKKEQEGLLGLRKNKIVQNFIGIKT